MKEKGTCCACGCKDCTGSDFSVSPYYCDSCYDECEQEEANLAVDRLKNED